MSDFHDSPFLLNILYIFFCCGTESGTAKPQTLDGSKAKGGSKSGTVFRKLARFCEVQVLKALILLTFLPIFSGTAKREKMSVDFLKV